MHVTDLGCKCDVAHDGEVGMGTHT
jgi:hypothetical protein